MSLLRMPKLRRLASAVERLRGCFSPASGRSASQRAYRRLLVDPLEERQLLSVAPANIDDTLINGMLSDSQFTYAAHSVDADHDGDFVAAWTRYDDVLDPLTGDPIIDPETGLIMTDANVYARYFTDEVQRLTLPEEVLGDQVATQYASFALLYGGNEVQKISVTASYEPFVLMQENLEGSFTLGFDLDRNDIISGSETTTIVFDETPPPDVSTAEHLLDLAETIQTGLQGLGGELNDVTVEALNPHEYLVYFGAASGGLDQPQITVEDFTFSAGFLPAVMTSTVREPTDFADIPVSPDNPDLTALAIEQSFSQSSVNFPIPPTDFPPPSRVPSTVEGPFFVPEVMRAAVPEVSVTPVLGVRNLDVQILTFDANTAGALTGPFLLSIDGFATGQINFDSTDLPTVAGDIQAQLAGLGYAGVTVSVLSATDPYQFEIEFVAGTEPPLIEYVPILDGFGDPLLDAEVDAKYDTYDGTIFDIAFTGDSGKKDHPELVVTAVEDEYGVSLIASPQLGVETLKEPSPEFRVNPEEPDNPFTILPDRYDQINPSVAMDADGEFVITWESEVPNIDNFGSVSDIFARRFTAAGLVDPADVTYFTDTDADGLMDSPVQGVRALETPQELRGVGVSAGDPYTFRVNEFTTNAQYQPHVDMDDAGNFVVAWANEGQDISFFNGIVARRFNRYGEPLGNEWLVNVEDTGIHVEPFVAMSSDGHFLVTWSLTHDADYIVPDTYTASVQVEVYSPQAAVLMEQFTIPAARRPTADFDMMNRFVISWDELADADNFGGVSEGAYGLMYELYDDAGEVSGNIIRSIFRASSASFNLGSNPLWPDWQGNTQAALDADGDLVITYEGFGPDVSEDVYSFMDLTGAFAEALGRQINLETNADLLVFFDPEVDTLPLMNFATDPSGDTRYSNLGADIDAAIEEVLINASVLGATDAQLGRLRAILDETAGLLRGDAWGMMFSRFDADPLLGPLNTLYSDSIANAHRDGHNERYIITLDEDTSGGSFTMRFYNRGDFEDVTVNVVTQNGVLMAWDTAEAINDALEAATLTGINWPEGIPVYEGPIDVRVLSTEFWNAELLARQGTDWELPFVLDTDYIFEVTFQGELHDTPLILSMAPGGNNLTAEPVAEVQYLYVNATADGWFALDFDGNTTGDMLWDSTSPGALAGTIENQLDGAGATDVQVVYMGTTIDGYEYYEVTFAGDSAGVNQPPVQQAAAQDHAAPEHAIFAGNIWSQQIIQGDSPDAAWPYIFSHTAGTIGTPQVEGSIGMEPDGDFVVAWTQYDLFTDGTYANNSIHYRRFDEDTDTAGPMVSDLVLPDGTQVDDGATIEVDPDGISHLILVFDEDMLAYDHATLEWAIEQRDLAEEAGDPVPGTVKAILDTVTNPENYRLFKNGVEVADGIVKVEFGMNKAADLADEYGLNPIPSNKWEAVLTVDGNGVFPGIEPLGSGLYTIQALAPIPETAGTAGQSGLRDKPGNPLNYTGYQERGGDFSRDFILTLGNQSDDPVTDPPPGELAENGRTYPETPGAVAVDGDGDHIVAWTAFDSSLGRDRAFVRLYEADGTPAPTAPFFFQATPVAQFPEFGDVDQRYATVACDEDGDFVVTWTQYDPVLDAQGHEVIDPLSGERLTETNIYARRYYANGLPKDDGPLDGLPFRVNTYTANNQKWSNVDMDTDGDFVVTWSSYGQEDNGQLGLGYGVYARQFDSLGQPIAPEFQVNVTTAGNQQFSSVAVDSIGGFVVAWTSDQNGIGDDIITRSFNSDGSPQEGLLGGELRVNQIVDGNQRYPDVDMNLAGTQFVITWSSSGEDGSGWGVYGRMFAREPAENVSPFKHYPSDDVPLAVPDSGFTILSTLDVPDSFLIRDLTVQLDLITPDPEDMVVRLISPGGTNILLFDDVPEPMQGGGRPPGRDFIGTILDDAAAVDITDSDRQRHYGPTPLHRPLCARGRPGHVRPRERFRELDSFSYGHFGESRLVLELRPAAAGTLVDSNPARSRRRQRVPGQHHQGWKPDVLVGGDGLQRGIHDHLERDR